MFVLSPGGDLFFCNFFLKFQHLGSGNIQPIDANQHADGSVPRNLFALNRYIYVGSFVSACLYLCQSDDLSKVLVAVVMIFFSMLCGSPAKFPELSSTRAIVSLVFFHLAPQFPNSVCTSTKNCACDHQLS